MDDVLLGRYFDDASLALFEGEASLACGVCGGEPRTFSLSLWCLGDGFVGLHDPDDGATVLVTNKEVATLLLKSMHLGYSLLCFSWRE